jgi:hypothetical protein
MLAVGDSSHYVFSLAKIVVHMVYTVPQTFASLQQMRSTDQIAETCGNSRQMHQGRMSSATQECSLGKRVSDIAADTTL